MINCLAELKLDATTLCPVQPLQVAHIASGQRPAAPRVAHSFCKFSSIYRQSKSYGDVSDKLSPPPGLLDKVDKQGDTRVIFVAKMHCCNVIILLPAPASHPQRQADLLPGLQSAQLP